MTGLSEWTLEELAKNEDLVKRNPHVFCQSGTPPAPSLKCTQMSQDVPTLANKYHVAPKEDRTYNGIVYDSKREASKAAELDLDVLAGNITFYLRQVPFDLGAGVKYVADFVTYLSVHDPDNVFQSSLFEVIVIEVKMWRKATVKHKAGFFFTADARNKMKLFREQYKELTLEIVK